MGPYQASRLALQVTIFEEIAYAFLIDYLLPRLFIGNKLRLRWLMEAEKRRFDAE
jgi:hypothetical protein